MCAYRSAYSAVEAKKQCPTFPLYYVKHQTLGTTDAHRITSLTPIKEFHFYLNSLILFIERFVSNKYYHRPIFHPSYLVGGSSWKRLGISLCSTPTHHIPGKQEIALQSLTGISSTQATLEVASEQPDYSCSGNIP